MSKTKHSEHKQHVAGVGVLVFERRTPVLGEAEIADRPLPSYRNLRKTAASLRAYGVVQQAV